MRITRFVNQMKSYGETVLEQNVMSKILRSLTSRFNNIIMAIVESKNLSTLSKDELQNSLKAHEQMMDERGNDKAKAEIALQARFNEKSKKLKEKWHSKGKENFKNFCGKYSQNSKGSIGKRGESNSKGSGQGNYTKKIHRSNVKCYNCHRLGHFARDCNAKSKAMRLREENYESNKLLNSTSSSCKLLDNSCSNLKNAAETRSKQNKMLREKLDNKGEMMLLVGYHSTGGPVIGYQNGVIDYGHDFLSLEADGTGMIEGVIRNKNPIIGYGNENAENQVAGGSVQQPVEAEIEENSKRPTRKRGLP
ncbi:uncharacterized protein LOC131649663 [Vicia villosa]|uniref:uncharacterized protein LOC131649663 n=1 Tax=Vicia villosa TaxID=3911 RepID=UPI00273B75AC|nr:uncharacterized protein LOC131649663 [Vicia villosa]